MKRAVLLIICILCAFQAFSAINLKKKKKVEDVLENVYKAERDTMPSFELMEFTVYGRRTASSARQQKKYDKTLRDVLKTYPYAKEVKAILVETYLYMQTLPDDESREKHIEEVEKGVWDQYYPIMKKMTYSQGKMLIKLIDRECNQTSYELINAFMGKFKAGFYQTFAKLFGASLKKEYDPEGEDADIEEIIYLIDHNLLTIIHE